MAQDSLQSSHDLTMTGREAVSITGVRHIERFDHEEFLLETTQGMLSIKGSDLHMVNVDVDRGLVSLTGKVAGLLYVEQASKERKSLMMKLFK